MQQCTTMDNKKWSHLRQKAEKILANKEQKYIDSSFIADVEKLIEELNIHHIELEMQNEELQKAYDQISEEKAKYEALYMHAPIAYFTLNDTGNIINLNLEAAKLLKIPAHQFNKTSIFPYLSPNSKTQFTKLWKQILRSNETVYAELTFIDQEQNSIYTHISAINYFDKNMNEKLVRCAVTDQSKIKKYKEALEKQKEINQINQRFETIFAAANAGMTIINNKGKITECNRAFAEMLGYETEELCNVSIEDITFSGDFGGDFTSASKIARQQNQTRFEKRYIHKNGGIVWCDVTASVVKNKHNDNYYVTVIKDISEQKYAEQKLRENEQRLELFFQQSHEGFFFMMLDEPVPWNDDTDKDAVLDYVFKHQKVTKVNNSMLKQYKARAEDFMKLTPEDFFAHDIAHGKKVWRKFFDNGRLHIDTREKKFDGTPMIITGEYICLYDEQNRITGHFGVQREVTQTREAEKALKISEEKFRTLIENSPLPIIMTNEKAQITDCNQALEKLLAISKKAITHKNIKDFHEKIFRPEQKNEQYRQYFAKQIEKLYNGHLSLPLIYTTNVGVNDQKKFVEQTLFRINTENGFRVASITRDVTAQTQAERTIREQKETLEKHSAEKNIFFNIIAHDLRSPFNALLGFSKLLLDKYDQYDDDTKKQHIEKIYQTSKNTFQLTENLLTWARTQTGKTAFQPAESDIGILVNDVTSQIKDLAEKKEITIVNNIYQNTKVYIDFNSIQTVLRNLLTNAIKFSYRNGNVYINAKPKNISNKSFLEICITDEGKGMNNEIAQNLFRLDKNISTQGTEKERGTGLGLLICKDFTERNGGTIYAESEPDKGSSFCFTVPLMDEKQPNQNESAPHETYDFATKMIKSLKERLNNEEQQKIIQKLDQYFQSTQKTMSSYALQQFAKAIDETANAYKIPEFKNLGKTLHNSTKELDLNQINQSLQSYELMRQGLLGEK